MGEHKHHDESDQPKPCQFRYVSMVNPQTGQGVLQLVPCPKTSKSNQILMRIGCPLWHEELNGCKLEIAIDFAVDMSMSQNKIIK